MSRLRSRNYPLLSAAAVISQLGSQGALIASAFAVLSTGGTAGDVGLVATARTVPMVLFVLVGGALADRIPRHRVMVAANALNFASQGTFGALVLLGHAPLWQMAALSALGGTGQALFGPANEGLLLSSVDPARAGRAFAVYRMAVNGATIGGAAAGGALVAWLGPGWVLVVDAGTFLVSGALRSFLDLSHVPARAPGAGVLADLRDGWREFVSRPWLWAIVAQFSVVNAVMVAGEAVYGPLVARDHYGGAGPWGVANAAFGAGTLLGAFVMTRWQPRRMLLAGTLGIFPFALPLAALAVPVSAALLTAAMFVAGASVEVFGVGWMTAMHQEIPEEKLSRVSSYDWLGSMALVPVATALAGPAQGAFGRSASLWGAAALAVLLTVAVLFVGDVRTIRRREPASPVDAAKAAASGADGPAATAADSV
ncbi:MFS transporter [Streptomyces fuscigenes]|uniref:MFS transporter n=1 Tax=Streptomyces fuscigenes TaxID=1528880 RepID=UPI001F21D94D|nr:MFS transporter [Streptomyces fuscigenes]MCF3963232.1 MFS transporter [Streptomyces fuscigenes]